MPLSAPFFFEIVVSRLARRFLQLHWDRCVSTGSTRRHHYLQHPGSTSDRIQTLSLKHLLIMPCLYQICFSIFCLNFARFSTFSSSKLLISYTTISYKDFNTSELYILNIYLLIQITRMHLFLFRMRLRYFCLAI